LHHVEAGDAGPPARGRQIPAQDAHGGGLAGPVRPEEAEHFPLLDREAHVVQGRVRAVRLAEVLSLNHRMSFPIEATLGTTGCPERMVSRSPPRAATVAGHPGAGRSPKADGL